MLETSESPLGTKQLEQNTNFENGIDNFTMQHSFPTFEYNSPVLETGPDLIIFSKDANYISPPSY